MKTWPHADFLKGISDHQREQYEIATTGNVGFLSGGPGTGKTTTSIALIEAIQIQEGILAELVDDTLSEDEKLRAAFSLAPDHRGGALIAVCAPTGKAATRSTEVMNSRGIHLTATTIHRLLEVRKCGHDGTGWEFFHNEDDPLPFHYIIIDEPSMIDTDLMAALFRAIRPGTKVLMVGDPDQLPPVGHGKAFKDMIDAGFPHGHLTVVHRFAGRIATVCDAIKRNKLWTPSPKVDLNFTDSDGFLYPENFLHIESSHPAGIIHEVMRRVEKFISSDPGDHRLRGLSPITDLQVLAPIKKPAADNTIKANVPTLNKRLQEMLNPLAHPVLGLRQELAHKFRIGDKVICGRNQFVEAWDPGVKMRPMVPGHTVTTMAPGTKHYVANGDIGEVVDGTNSEIIVQFGNRYVIFKVPIEHLTLAYAITGHKSQGSQWPVTICIIDEDAVRVCNRSYWYTILSRASRLCITVGRLNTVRKHCEKEPLNERVTFLKDDLKSWLENSQQSLQSANSP